VSFKKLFEILNDGTYVQDEEEVTYDLDCFMKDTLGLINSSRPSDYLEKFLDLYWSDKIVNVEKRIPLFKKFYDNNLFKKDELVKAYNDYLYKAFYADCPKIGLFSAQIYTQLVKENIFSFDSILYNPMKIGDEDQREDYKFFMEDLAENFAKLIKKESL